MPGELIPIAFFAMIAVVVVGGPVARAYARRLDRGESGDNAAANVELLERMGRMEQTLDAMSVEIERITEGQRFTTKLLAERHGDAPDAGGAAAREVQHAR